MFWIAKNARYIGAAVFSISVLLLAGCKEEETALADAPVRAIKTMVLKDRAADQVRRISGIVEAETVTDLSFETSGQITKLLVDVGDFVDKDQVIGELDSEPYKLKVDSALGEVQTANANLKDAQEKFTQQSALRKKGFTTKTNFDTATANLEVAKSQLKVTQTKLSIAERDLRKTQLLAPFRGRVSEKYVDVFADVQGGQKVVQMHTEGKLKVQVSVPEGLVRYFKTGDKVSVSFPTLRSLTTEGSIDEISSRAGAANAFPLEITLDQQYPELRPGIAAEVTFRFATGATGAAFVVPTTALLPAEENKKAYLFVFDAKDSVVKKTKVEIINIRDNELEIASDLKPGDVIATAGVSFLTDGMKVKLWKGK